MLSAKLRWFLWHPMSCANVACSNTNPRPFHQNLGLYVPTAAICTTSLLRCEAGSLYRSELGVQVQRCRPEENNHKKTSKITMNHELRWETRLAGWVCTPVRNPARSRRRFVLFQKHEIQILSYRTEENPQENENENNLAFLQHFLRRTRRKRGGGKHKAPPGHHTQTPTFYIPKTHSSYQKRRPKAGRGNERRVSGRVYKNGTFIATERSCT